MLIGTDRGRSLIQSHSPLINHYYALAFTLGRITQIAGMLPYTTHNKPVWADSWLLEILVSTFLSASLQKTNILDNPPPPPTLGLWSSGFRHDLNFSGLVYNSFHLFPNFNFVRAIKQFILHLKLFARSNLFIALHIVWNIIRFKCIILLLQNKYALQWIIFLFSLNIIYFDWEFVIAIINVRFVK